MRSNCKQERLVLLREEIVEPEEFEDLPSEDNPDWEE